MSKVTINVKAHGRPGDTESHFGYPCVVGPEGQLFADVPEDLIQVELDHGRVKLVSDVPVGVPIIAPVPEFDPATSEDVIALRAYAIERGIAVHHAAGVAKIREAIAAAQVA